MHLQGIKEERERSARKLAEIQEEVDANRETTYLYIKERKDVLGSKCVADLEFYDKGKKYLEWLSLNGHLSRVKRTIGGKRQYIYNVSAIPYTKPDRNAEAEVNTEAMDKVASVTRVFNLLDRPQERTTKAQRERDRKSYTGSMQSGMQLFGNW